MTSPCGLIWAPVTVIYCSRIKSVPSHLFCQLNIIIHVQHIWIQLIIQNFWLPYCDKSSYKCWVQNSLPSHCGIPTSTEIHFSSDPNVLYCQYVLQIHWHEKEALCQEAMRFKMHFCATVLNWQLCLHGGWMKRENIWGGENFLGSASDVPWQQAASYNRELWSCIKLSQPTQLLQKKPGIANTLGFEWLASFLQSLVSHIMVDEEPKMYFKP